MNCSGDTIVTATGARVSYRNADEHPPAEMDLIAGGVLPIPGQQAEPSFTRRCPVCGREALESRPRAWLE